MPALRNKRQSRTGTPHDSPYQTPAPNSDPKKQKMQSSLDTWIEPPLKNPAPSFEDHGFARQGVLQGMSALEQGPSARMKQQVKALAEPATRRSSFARNGSYFASDEAASTPEMTPAPELEQEDMEKQEEEEVKVVSQAPEEDEDDDYIPTKKPKTKLQAVKTPVRGKTPVQNKTPVTSRTPAKNGVSRPSTAMSNPATPNAPVLSDSFAADQQRQRLQIVVNDAISRSRTNNDFVIEQALWQLGEDSKADEHVKGFLEAIIHQTATQDQYVAFRHYIKDAKKRIKRETRKREARRTQDASSRPSSDFAGGPRRSVLPNHSNDLMARMNEHTSHTMDANIDHESVTPQETSAEVQDAQNTLHPLTTAPVLPSIQSPSPLPSRMPSKSPRKHRTSNGVTMHGTGADIEIDASTKAPTLAGNTPESGVGSDSDLSEVNEEIVQNGPPESLQANGNGAATAPISRKARQAAIARAGKKSRANSAKPNGKYEKKPPPTAKDVAEELDLQRKREAMAEQQLSRLEYNPPTSDLRYDDEMLETESLTDSQIAVGPPVDVSRPQRHGKATRESKIAPIGLGKRLREDSSRVPSSPLLDSAGNSRPTTPAYVAAGAGKRLKLNNGQAARTKRSPVKNRDGPIAGIAHTGGGGSRHLGPDDNDLGSPPESDDWCAACKGAGEFVCCDGCPRVFHFLCCDPPRLGPPNGSFFCYDCTAQLKRAEEPVAELPSIFAPLFKQLDTTNTRAFALPADIQNHFEDVSARVDGSYFEETKKFPLAKSSGYGYQKPDYLKTHDSEHRPILCVQCGQSSAGKRQMLKCDYCHAYWHLDCCEPPLANPPHISLEASHRDAWKCPRHIDHDLRSGSLVQNDLNAIDCDAVQSINAATVVRVGRKVRKPKHPSIIEPTFSRAIRNNGLIEVINSPDDDTDGEGNYVFTPDEAKDFNAKTFRVPEKGLILDFIGKVKRDRVRERIEERKEGRRAAKVAARRKASQQLFAARPIQQQQAALHLAQLANKDQEIGLADTSVNALYLSLTAEAPSEVLSAISDAGPGPMTDDERAELLKLRALIDRALAA